MFILSGDLEVENITTGSSLMIALKKAGVSDEIVGAMLETKEGAAGYSDSQPITKPVSGSSSGSEDKLLNNMPEPGIYLSENGKLTSSGEERRTPTRRRADQRPQTGPG